MNYLADFGHEVHYLSHTGPHQTYLPGTKLIDGEEFKFYLHGSGTKPFCEDLIENKLKELKPDIFGILLDTFMLYPWLLSKDLSPAKSLFYFPSDGGGFPANCETILRKVDLPVSMSMYAQRQVKDLFNIDADYIPHAVDTDFYKPFSPEEKLLAKQKFGVNGKFVFGCVARNQGRKMLDRQLKSFALVKDQMPNAIMLMHTDRNDPASYFNIDHLINQLGIKNRVYFTNMTHHSGIPYKDMATLYNAMDAFFLSTSGEGFGIPTLEAMSCGIPVLITNYTTTWELVTRNNCGIAVKVSDELLGNWHVDRALMDIKDGANALLTIYQDAKLRENYSINGRNAAVREYSWTEVSKQWNDLLLKLNAK